MEVSGGIDNLNFDFSERNPPRFKKITWYLVIELFKANSSHFIFFVFYLLYIISILHFLFWICIWIVCLLVISMLSFQPKIITFQTKTFSNCRQCIHRVLKLVARGRCFLRFVKKKKKVVLWWAFRHCGVWRFANDFKQDPNSKILLDLKRQQ